MASQRHVTLAVSFRRITRSFEAIGDNARLTSHHITTEFGREWEHPERVLTDDEIEALDNRALGRTLAAIDDL